MRSEGTLVDDGELAEIRFDRLYRHSLEHVWAAISTPEGLAGWLMCTRATIEPRVGGRIDMVSGRPGYSSTGRILVWDPPRTLEYEWNVAPVPEMPVGERAIFRYELRAEGDATHLHVIYRRITRSTASGFIPGLHAFLDRLAAQLDGRPLPDWAERFAAAGAMYPQWRGHASTAGQ